MVKIIVSAGPLLGFHICLGDGKDEALTRLLDLQSAQKQRVGNAPSGGHLGLNEHHGP